MLRIIRRFRGFAGFTLPYLPLWLAPLVLFAPVIFKGEALFWGTPYLQFTPWRAWAWETLLRGQLPLWNPLSGMGAPLAANYQSALFYPPNWLLFLLAALGGTAWLAWGQAVLVAAHLAWSGFGMAWLGRKLGFNPLAQTICGLAFGLSGYLVARAGFLSINAAAAWLPWVLAASTLLASPIRIDPDGAKHSLFKRILPLSICLGFQLLAGHAQTTYYTILLLLAWVGVWSWLQNRRRGLMIALGRLALAAGLAAAFAAVQLFPTAEYLMQSQRAASVDYATTMNYSFFPLRFLTLIAPNLFGSPAQAGGYFFRADNYWEDAIYIGLLPFLLALTAGFHGILGQFFKKKTILFKPDADTPMVRLSRFLVGLILVSFILGFGKFTPVFPFLYQYVPTFNMFQAPARFILWAEVGLALLAGIAVQWWRKPGGRLRGWVKRGIAAAAATLLGAGLTLVVLNGVKPAFIQAVALTGGIALLCGFLALRAPEDDRPSSSWCAAAVTLVCVDLLIANWGLNPGVPLDLYRAPSPDQVDIKAQLAGHRLYIAKNDEDALKFSRFFTLNNYAIPEDWQNLRGVYLPDSAMLDGIPSANNFDPLVPERFAVWMKALEQVEDQATRLNLLKLMDVGLIEEADLQNLSHVIFSPLDGASRFRWTSCTQAAASPQAALDLVMARARAGGADLAASVALEGAPMDTKPCTSQGEAVLNLMINDPGHIKVSASAEGAGWLVVADTNYPGWQARIDGVLTPIRTADFLFKAVSVPSGVHEIELTYRPTSFFLGGAVTLLAIILVQILNIMTRTRTYGV